MSAALTEDTAQGLADALGDASSCRDGVAMLVALLAQAGDEAALLAQPQARQGLRALLDGVRTRLDLACDGLQGVALQLGLEVAT